MTHEIESRPYSDWFGSGNTKEDVEKIIQQHGEPEEVLLEGEGEHLTPGETGWMACLLYADKVIVTGYDESEYCHTFVFPRKNPEP